MDIEIANHIVIPILIFLSRVVDVSLGTMRIILVSKSFKIYASILGFFEVLIWIVAIGQLMGDVNNITTYLAYALGFSVGTYIGMIIEEKVAIGTLLLQVITKNHKKELLDILKEKNVRAFDINAKSKDGEVGVIYVIVTRKNYKKVAKNITEVDPKAFFAVEDINVVQEELENVLEGGPRYNLFKLFSKFKKKV
jgi:uncharacterized protein YebE (UPF0316 family)